MAYDLEGMNIDELRALRKAVDKAIVTYEDRAKREARAKVEEIAREHGFKLEELLGDKSVKGRQTSASAPKYVHPANPAITWTGRGRQPGWIKEGLAAGKSLDDFLIK